MKKYSIWILVLCLIVCSFSFRILTLSNGTNYLEQKNPSVEKKQITEEKEQETVSQAALSLHATAAVLMDAATGRVLYGKNETQQMPMASTTKIMTCICALENGNLSDTVTFSENAARQPKVHLGAAQGEQLTLRNLLYALMLESYNDAAVAIAEQISGSVEEFAKLMNQKARDLGCEDTFFITPNGLDATVTLEDGTVLTHHTTAENLAKIMCYCLYQSPSSKEFIEITRTPQYTFSDLSGKKQYQISNHNAFLSMMDGVVSGKTGFTNKAGYCYVGAVEAGEKKFVASLLACGWPNHRNYKWMDMRTLINYGIESFEYQTETASAQKIYLPPIKVSGASCFADEEVNLNLQLVREEVFSVLTKADEQIQTTCHLPSSLPAPIEKGMVLGSVTYTIDGFPVLSVPVCAEKAISKCTLYDCIVTVMKMIINFS